MVEISLARIIDDFEKGDTTDWSITVGTATKHIDGLFPYRGAKSFRGNVTVGNSVTFRKTFSPVQDWSNFKEFICMTTAPISYSISMILHDVVGGNRTIQSKTQLDPYKYLLTKKSISTFTRTQIDYIEISFSSLGSVPCDCFIDDILLSRKNDNYITFDPKPRIWNIDLAFRTPTTPIPNRIGGITQGVGSENQRFTVDGIMKKGTTYASSYYYLMKKLQGYAHNNNIVVLTDATEAFIIPGMLSNLSYGRGSKKEWFPYDFDITEFTELGGEAL